ncbi:hypothetical protein K4F52_001281 [Lecanicillium sp. MT-2017a]|nr:hypothetical protein K4F52_001281 [Lecanicillium sp. MT-2017a]
MALINPVYAFVVPFLFVVTVPLAVFAGITTTLAFSVLICRVIIVYLDIALSLINRSLIGLKVPTHLHHAAARADTPSPTHSTANLVYHPRRRRRRPSSASILSGGSITPVNNGNDTGLGLIPSIGAERDFEGVGGWRVGDDDIWTTINSRFELHDRQHARNHHRSPSGGGPTTPGDGGFLMMKRRTRSPESAAAAMTGPLKTAPTSPNCSRTRTPSASRVSFGGSSAFADGYFPFTMSSSKVPGKKQSPPQPA